MKNKTVFFCVLYFSALTTGMGQMKIVPILGSICNDLNVSMTHASMLMSIYYVSGVILALPGGSLLAKIGPKRLLLLLMACVASGNCVGAFVHSFSYELLMISRFVEGIAFGMIIMVGIVFLSEWFKDGNHGLFIASYTTFPATSSVIAMNTVIPVSAYLGADSPWWIIFTFAIISIVLIDTFIRDPEPPEQQPGIENNINETLNKPSIREAFKNPGLWLLAICQCCGSIVCFAFITLYPDLFTRFYGADLTTANFLAGMSGLFSIFFCILTGIIIDKTKHPNLIVLSSFILMAVVCFFTTLLNTNTYIIHTALIALSSGLILAGNFANVPLIAKSPSQIGYSAAVLNMLYFIGTVVAAPVTSNIIEQSGWKAASVFLIIISIIGITIAVFMSIGRRRRSGPSAQTFFL